MEVVFVSELREKFSQAVQEKTQAAVDVEALRDHLRDSRDEVSRSTVNRGHPHIGTSSPGSSLQALL